MPSPFIVMFVSRDIDFLLSIAVPTWIVCRSYPSFHTFGDGLEMHSRRAFTTKWGKNGRILYQLLFSQHWVWRRILWRRIFSPWLLRLIARNYLLSELPPTSKRILRASLYFSTRFKSFSVTVSRRDRFELCCRSQIFTFRAMLFLLRWRT